MTPPPPPENPYSSAAAAQPLNPADEKMWSILTHIGGIFFGFIPALIVYLVFRDRGPFVHQHSAAALNFQLTMLIASVVSGILVLIIIGIFLLIAISILIIVFSIIAAVTANRGEQYSYPLSIKFVN